MELESKATEPIVLDKTFSTKANGRRDVEHGEREKGIDAKVDRERNDIKRLKQQNQMCISFETMFNCQCSFWLYEHMSTEFCEYLSQPIYANYFWHSFSFSMDPAIQTPLPPPNQNTQLSEIRTSNQNLNAQRNVVALGPLRWNIVKLCQSWDTAINNLVAQNDSSHTELIKKHKKQSHSHNNSKKHQWEQQKSKVPLHKRLAQMRMSYDNLKHASQHSRAASLKRRMDPMIDSFYKKELSSHITKARSATKKMTERQQKEEAELVVGNQLQLQNLMKEKDKEVKFLRRKNERSSDDPFAIHYAAVNGELSRLDVLLARPKILNNIDLRDSDSGWTALHFASRSGHVKFAQRLLECKANVNALGPNNETCLHLAAGWGTKEMVGLLLQVGADKTMIDAKGHTGESHSVTALR